MRCRLQPPTALPNNTALRPARPPDLSEQLRQARKHNASLQSEVEALTAAVSRLQRAAADAHASLSHRHPAAGPWQAASFLLLFLLVINIAGAVASFHMAASTFSFFGWGFKQQATSGLLARPALEAIAAAVPLANTGVVLVFCVQAVKAAWMCLRF